MSRSIESNQPYELRQDGVNAAMFRLQCLANYLPYPALFDRSVDMTQSKELPGFTFNLFAAFHSLSVLIPFSIASPSPRPTGADRRLSISFRLLPHLFVQQGDPPPVSAQQ